MAKIPFDIKYRPQIESGEYKVETESGAPAKILDWEWNNEHTGVCLVVKITEKGKDSGYLYTEYGKRAGLFPYEKDSDLFLVTQEEELTPFEEKLIQFSDERNSMESDNLPEDREGEILADHLHRKAAELLALAEKEIAKRHERDVYIPEDTYCEQLQKQWDEGYGKGKDKALRTHATGLTENLAKSRLDKDSIPYHLIEFMCNLYTCQNWKEIEETAEAYVTRIKAVALKDLPRWKPAARAYDGDRLPRIDWSLNRLVARFGEGIFYLDIRELYKLPGFKEDSHE